MNEVKSFQIVEIIENQSTMLRPPSLSAVAMQQVTLLCITLIIGTSAPLAQGASQNGNDNGTITWADLPQGEEYSAQMDYDEGSFPLPSTWDAIDGFLKLISPADPPYDLINNVLKGEALDVNTLTSDYAQFQGNLLGFGICFGLGALFVIIFPIVCLCFCCCRCCNNCGGKMYQEQRDNDRCKRVCFAVSLVIVTAVIAGGIGTAYSVNMFITQTVDTLPEDIVANIDDMLTYVNNTLAEIDFLVNDQLSWTLDQISTDLNAIGTFVGEPVRDELRTNVGPAIDSIYPLDDAIDNTYNAMAAVNTTQNEMEPLWEDFDAALTIADNGLRGSCTTCGCCSGADWPGFITINSDYRDASSTTPNARFPQQVVDESLSQLKDVQDQDLTAKANIGKQSFEDIPETLKNTTEDFIKDIIDTLNSLKSEIPNLLNGTTAQLDVLDDQVTPIKSDIDEYGTMIQEYDMYRVSAVYGLYAVFLLTVVLNILGLMCGWCGYDKDATPTLRGGVSNCGGLTLMSAVGISMIFATFYMFFTMLTFIIGGPIDRLVCDPIVSGQVFNQTIDKKDAIKEGYYLGDLLFQNSSIPLTVTGILDGCENNDGVYETFHLENFLNISSFLDFNQFIPNIDDEFEDIVGNFSNIEILTPEARQILIDFRDSEADTIDWTVVKTEFEKTLTSQGNDLHAYAAELDVFANTLSDLQKNAFIVHATAMRNLNPQATVLVDKAALLVSQIETLEGFTGTIDNSVNNVISSLDDAQDYIEDNVANLVSAEIVKFEKRILNYPDQFVTYAVEQVTTEVGRCRPVYNLWNSATRILCRNLLESFNAIWFTLGWCTVFLMPSIIFGVKLAKHYRIMDYEDSYDDYLTPHEMEMAHMNQSPMYPPSNKVAPGHV